jgi:hypothetical protein
VVLSCGGLIIVSGLEAPAASASGGAPLGIYVGDVDGNDQVTFPLPSNGDVAPSVVNSSSSIDGPYGEAFDAHGNLWVANYSGHTLTEFTSDQLTSSGSPSPAVTISDNGSGSLDGPVGLAFTPGGDLWVGDYDGATLDEFTPTQLAATGSPTPAVTITSVGVSLEGVEEIGFDGSGDLWAAASSSSQMSAYTPAQLAAGGALTPSVVLTGTELNDVQGVAFDAQGNLWVGNCLGANSGNLSEYTPAQFASSGSPTPAVTLTSDGSNDLGCTYAMEFDHSGNLWVANSDTMAGVSGFSPSQLASSGSPTPVNRIAGTTTTLRAAAGLALADTPMAPTSVAATTGAGGTVRLTWQAAVGGTAATDYVVTPVENGVPQGAIDTHSSAPSFALTVQPNVSYTFGVAGSNVFGAGSSGRSNSVQTRGYWEAASDGGLFALQAPYYGSQGGKPLNEPVVGVAATPDGRGYWEVASDGGIFNYGDAGFLGSMGGKPLNKPIVGIAAAPDGKGYWEVASDGGIFNFGDAGFYGSMGGKPLNKPVVGIAATPDGKGYWEVASDGGIFNFGDAGFFGSSGSLHLNKPVVGIAATPDGLGYWLVAFDGGIFNYGDAGFLGSEGATPLNKPVVGMAGSLVGNGYWEVASDGGIFNLGQAGFFGSMGGTVLNKPIVGMS